MIAPLTITQTLGPHSQEEAGKSQGITDPWHAWGLDDKKVRRRVMLKLAYPGLVENHFSRLEMLIRECICHQLLCVLGVPVPKPYLASIPSLVIDSMRSRPDIQSELRKNPMPHFACEYLENMNDLPPWWKIPQVFLTVAEDILASDSLVLNADRTTGKPNILIDAHRMVAIDFGLSFELLKFQPKADRLPPDIVHNHVCYNAILQAKPSFSKVFAAWVQCVSQDVLNSIELSIPTDWKSETIDVNLMLNHLRAHDGRLDKIRSELTKLFPQ